MRWLFVSDAHLDIKPQSRPTSAALAEFLGHVADDSRRSTTRLVLLGDMFELLGPTGGGEAAAVERLNALAVGRSEVFAALRGCIEAGVSIDVVPGNHDLDLVRPSVAGRLRALLGLGDDDERVRVSPWLYVVPGVLYAEHGNQHHDLNRFPRILDPYSLDRHDELHTPPLATRDRLVATNQFTRRRHAAALVRSLAATYWGERVARRHSYRERVRTYARSLGLDPVLVTELERLSHVRPIRTIRRIAGRFLGERLVPADAYLLRAARSVHLVTSARQAATPLYIFGHTHIARDVPLDGSARYLNCGTWSTSLHGDDPVAADPLRFPFIEVVSDHHGVRAALCWWHHMSLEPDVSRVLSLHRTRSRS
jgi:hypothetical protein